MTRPSSISVGIPAYNQGSFLRETVSSLLRQDLEAAEIVVSDNHSTDETASVLDEFSGKIRVIRPKVHLPMAEHWNFVASRLNGSWIALLSSDDIAKPNYIATLLAGSTRSKNAVLVRAGWETIDSAGNLLEKRYQISLNRITTQPDTLYEQLLGPKTSFAAFAVRKSAWERVGGFPENLALLADWGFWLRLAPTGDFIYEHEIISQYRTDYRPALQQRRMVPWLLDEVDISLHLIPQIASRLSTVDSKRISRASDKRFLSCLKEASKSIAAADREAASAALEAWSRTAGQENLLRKFRNGEKIHGPDAYAAARKIVRAVYSKLVT